jgi:predicted  nucleic acid-binding Zn-ribbon protein
MLAELEQLLTLQDRDQRIRTFKNELTALPDEKRFKEKQIADSAHKLEQSKTRMKEIEVERKRLELEAQSKRDAIGRYKTQQFQTRKNEEFAALSHEIAAAEKDIVVIEDHEIELMEEAESLRPAIFGAEAEFVTERARLQGQLADLEQKTLSIAARIAELESSRAQLTDGIDEDLLSRYERLFKSKQGSAIVQLEHEVCTGCHMKVPTQTAIAVRAEKSIVHCSNCGRMLHLPA